MGLTAHLRRLFLRTYQQNVLATNLRQLRPTFCVYSKYGTCKLLSKYKASRQIWLKSYNKWNRCCVHKLSATQKHIVLKNYKANKSVKMCPILHNIELPRDILLKLTKSCNSISFITIAIKVVYIHVHK